MTWVLRNTRDGGYLAADPDGFYYTADPRDATKFGTESLDTPTDLRSSNKSTNHSLGT